MQLNPEKPDSLSEERSYPKLRSNGSSAREALTPGRSQTGERHSLVREAKVNILLVDDRADGLLALEAVLDCPEHNLVTASNGQEALARLVDHEFAVILLDVQMPGMDGFETARVIKKNDAWKNIPIIFITAINKDTHHISRGYESGAVDYLFKPFDPYILQSKVRIFAELFLNNLKLQERTLELSFANRALELEMAERIRAQKEILEISGREQKRIGQDLHDGLAQQLAAISFLSKILWQKLSAKSDPEAQQALEIMELCKKSIHETKSLARGFYPIELERLGFYPALEELIINTEKLFKVFCTYQFDPEITISDHGVATHIYRITQEAMHNSIKHGKAKRIIVSMHRSGDGAELTVKDDGMGMPEILGSEEGMGLRIMNYRAKMIGGLLDIRSDETGTCVALRLQPGCK